MESLVLNCTFGFLINISAKLKVSASKSATSQSRKSLKAIKIWPEKQSWLVPQDQKILSII